MASPEIRQVALVSDTSSVSFSDTTSASAAIQKQVTRDFGPLWNVQATVDGFAKLEDVPIGYWPVIVLDNIDDPSALGYHTDKNGQPYALVKFTETWALTASHEILEMLADPFGNRVIAGDSPKQDQGRVAFLVEVCDPCEAVQYGYTVNGLTLSDFYSPSYFDPVASGSVQYDSTDSISEPREVLPGGYLSWHDLVTDHWWQEIYFDNQPQFRDLGKLDQRAGSIREQIERLTYPDSMKSRTGDTSRLQEARSYRDNVCQATAARAQALRAEIAAIRKGAGRIGKEEGAAGGRRPDHLNLRRAPRKGRRASGQ